MHGGIDGFSRLILYLTAATNNRAQTVLESFLSAVEQYGIPSRVRSDKGGETFWLHASWWPVVDSIATLTLLEEVSTIRGAWHTNKVIWLVEFLDICSNCYGHNKINLLAQPCDQQHIQRTPSWGLFLNKRDFIHKSLPWINQNYESLEAWPNRTIFFLKKGGKTGPTTQWAFTFYILYSWN